MSPKKLLCSPTKQNQHNLSESIHCSACDHLNPNCPNCVTLYHQKYWEWAMLLHQQRILQARNPQQQMIPIASERTNQTRDDQPLDLSVPSRAPASQNLNGMVRRMSCQNGSTSGQENDHQVQKGSGSLGSSTGGSSERRNSILDNLEQNKAYWANYHLHQALHKAKVYSQIRNSKRRNSALGIESDGAGNSKQTVGYNPLTNQHYSQYPTDYGQINHHFHQNQIKRRSSLQPMQPVNGQIGGYPVAESLSQNPLKRKIADNL